MLRDSPPETYMQLEKETCVVNFTDVNYDYDEPKCSVEKRKE